MSDVVKQGGEPDDLPPGDERFPVGEDVVDVGMPIAFAGDDIEDATGQFHHAQGVLEPAMGRTRVDEVWCLATAPAHRTSPSRIGSRIYNQWTRP